MKKLIRISLTALSFAFIGTAYAKIMKRKTVPSTTVSVTKNEKQMFVDTKALKNASSAQEKVAAVTKLAADIKSNPNARLVLEEQVLREEINELEKKIAQEEGYISYLDTEEVTEDKKQLEELYAELAAVETKLKKTVTTRPQAVSYLNYWSVRALIGAVGIALAYKLGAGKALMTTASTVWGYVPSWRSTPSTETISDFIPVVTAATTTTALTWGQTASNVIASARDLLLSGAMTGTASYIGNKVYIMLMDLEKAEKDPSVTPEELKEKIVELQKLLDEFKVQNSKNK